MLTNKKLGVLIIMLSLFFVSCSADNAEIEKNNKEAINVISGEKSKALGGEALQEGSKTVSISNGNNDTPPQEPNIIK